MPVHAHRRAPWSGDRSVIERANVRRRSPDGPPTGLERLVDLVRMPPLTTCANYANEHVKPGERQSVVDQSLMSVGGSLTGTRRSSLEVVPGGRKSSSTAEHRGDPRRRAVRLLPREECVFRGYSPRNDPQVASSRGGCATAPSREKIPDAAPRSSTTTCARPTRCGSPRAPGVASEGGRELGS